MEIPRQAGLAIILILGLYSLPAQSKVLEAGQGQTYPRLRQALAIAQPGDEIRLHAGTYFENELEINQPLKLSGIDFPVIDGGGKGNLLKITAPGVTVQGLTLRNSGFSHVHDLAAIRLEAADSIVQNNRIENAHFGIYLSAADRSKISGNQVNGKAWRESNSANAIHVWKSVDLILENNQVSGHRDGFYFEFVKNSLIQGNTSSGNLRYGLHFMFSDGNTYQRNTFSKNGAGVAVMYTRNIKMKENLFLDNWGPTSYGLLLKDINQSEIEDNRFEHNTVGIHMEGSSRLKIRHNQILNNGWAARVHANCNENQIEYNQFSGNAFDIATNGSDSSQTGNSFQHNFWDKYTGYDLNHDGVGDVPYHPVSIFSRLVEKVPPSLILLRSFLVQVMDLAEHVAPVLTPKTLVDPTPQMRRVK